MDPAELGFAIPRPVGSVPEIEEAVRQAIRKSGGRITYARFLEICLYHPARGYYAAFGPETDEHAAQPAADYFTAVDLHPAFGHLVARALGKHLEELRGSTSQRLWIVELGGGRGLLARDVLLALRAEFPELSARVRYLLLEPNPGWAQIQRRNLLPEFDGQVRWARSAGVALPLRGIVGAFVANELFDALPFHVVEGSKEGPVELFVTVANGPEAPLAEVPGALSNARIVATLAREGVRLAPGQRAEVGLRAQEMAASIAAALARGAALVTDYGDEARELFDAARHPRGTVRCFFRHRMCEQPFERVGRQDITADVDFTALSTAFESAGMRVAPLERQGDFLDRLGLQAFVDKLERDAARIPRETYVRHRRALDALRDRKGLGRNLVLRASRP